jgi:glucosylceramidase
MFERARIVLDDPAARLFVWGTAFHWYCGDHFDNVQALHDAYPEKQLLFSEGCREGGPHLGSWELGERYAHSMINDLNRWTVGWIDWNLLLDRTGGPNHAENLCSAPLIANTKSGRLHYQSSYFYIGHFSRYLRPGAVRILSVSTSDHLESTAFLNTDGRIAVVVLNRGSLPVHFTLKHGELSAASVSPAHSIATYLLRE